MYYEGLITTTGLKCTTYWSMQLNLTLIDKNQPEMDLVSLMTKVAEFVSEKKSTGVSQVAKKLSKVQIPCIVSTLKKQIFLPRE